MRPTVSIRFLRWEYTKPSILRSGLPRRFSRGCANRGRGGGIKAGATIRSDITLGIERVSTEGIGGLANPHFGSAAKRSPREGMTIPVSRLFLADGKERLFWDMRLKCPSHAASGIEDYLNAGRALNAYQSWMAGKLNDYLISRRHYHAKERWWGNSLFWQRRERPWQRSARMLNHNSLSHLPAPRDSAVSGFSSSRSEPESIYQPVDLALLLFILKLLELTILSHCSFTSVISAPFDI